MEIIWKWGIKLWHSPRPSFLSTTDFSPVLQLSPLIAHERDLTKLLAARRYGRVYCLYPKTFYDILVRAFIYYERHVQG